MNPLSDHEKDKIARHLAYSATAGGWFFVGLAAFTVVLFFLPVFGLLNSELALDGEYISILITIVLVCVLPGLWLLRRQSKIRALLDEELLSGTAEVLGITGPDPYRGWTVTLLVTPPFRPPTESILQSYARPSWTIGEQIELLFLEDESRFFPRHLTHNMNLGRLPMGPQLAAQKRWRYLILWLVGGLLLIGFTMGFMSGW